MAKKKAEKAHKNSKVKKAKTLPKRDAKAEYKFHHFLDLWNTHIREQINVHRKILEGKQSLRQHIAQTKKIHHKFLKQLGKL